MMKRVLIFLLSLFMLTLPALASEDPTTDEPPVSATDIYLDISEYLDIAEPAGEVQYEKLYTELVQLRANTDYIFLGVIALSGVVLGCSIGITLMRMWGA